VCQGCRREKKGEDDPPREFPGTSESDGQEFGQPDMCRLDGCRERYIGIDHGSTGKESA